jgi:hypothetical protein
MKSEADMDSITKQLGDEVTRLKAELEHERAANGFKEYKEENERLKAELADANTEIEVRAICTKAQRERAEKAEAENVALKELLNEARYYVQRCHDTCDVACAEDTHKCCADTLERLDAARKP